MRVSTAIVCKKSDDIMESTAWTENSSNSWNKAACRGTQKVTLVYTGTRSLLVNYPVQLLALFWLCFLCLFSSKVSNHKEL